MEQWRSYWGRGVNSAVIESTLQSAAHGYLRDLCDLGYETLRADPHLAAIVSKRLRAVASIPPRVTAANGIGIDSETANFYADMVRWQLSKIPRLRQRLANMAASIWFGRAALEIEWVETKDPKERWRVKNLHWIHSRRLCLGPDRELRVNDGMWQGTGFEKVGFDLREVPFKFITCQRQLFSEYNEREGLLPNALFYSFFKRFGWRERLALTELYGKPLRWIEFDPNTVTKTDDTVLDKARDIADDMGSDHAAAFPPGVKLVMQSVGQGSSAVHKEIMEDCNKELSKLVLGSTNTTDAAPAGLGSEQARVHQDGELLVFTTDCDEIAEDLTHSLARAIVQLNGGPEAAELYTPKVELPFEVPPDPKLELERAKMMLEMRLPLKVDEVYERSGYSKPVDGDQVISELPTPAPANPLDGLFRAAVTPSDTSAQSSEPEPRKTSPGPAKFSQWRQGRSLLTGPVLEERLVQGIPLCIDRPVGFVQQGIGPDGASWSRTYQRDYGFIPNTQGGDGEGLDVFLGPDLGSANVYWVKQVKPTSAGSVFDEYKLFVGFASASDALECYGAHIPPQFFGGLEQSTIGQVKSLLGLDPRPMMGARDPLALERATKVLGLIGLLGDEVRG